MNLHEFPYFLKYNCISYIIVKRKPHRRFSVVKPCKLLQQVRKVILKLNIK